MSGGIKSIRKNVGNFLGGKPSKTKSTTAPLFRGTDFTSVSNGIVSLDPSIRAFQNQGLTSLNEGQRVLGEATGRFGESLGGLRDQLFTNQDPFLQARTDPLESRFAAESGQLRRDLGRRGLGGSSFASAAQTNQSVEQSRALVNERALATQESINAGIGIDQLILQAQQAEAAGDFQKAQLLQQIAADRQAGELAIITPTATQTTATGARKGLLDFVSGAVKTGSGTVGIG